MVDEYTAIRTRLVDDITYAWKDSTWTKVYVISPGTAPPVDQSYATIERSGPILGEFQNASFDMTTFKFKIRGYFPVTDNEDYDLASIQKVASLRSRLVMRNYTQYGMVPMVSEVYPERGRIQDDRIVVELDFSVKVMLDRNLGTGTDAVEVGLGGIL